LLVDTVEDYAIFLVDAGGKVASWNSGASRMLGYDEGEIVGQPFARIFTPEDVAQGAPEREMSKATAEGRAEDNRWHVRKDGRRFWSAGVLVPLRDDAGRLHGYGKVLHDITLRKHLEEELKRHADELRRADVRKNEFLATLSHELRNPLAPILNALHILRRDKCENPMAQQAREVMERQLRHLMRLVDDLLDISRIARGKIQLRKERVELDFVLDRAAENARPRFEARNQEFTVSLSPVPVWLEADPTRLEQVFINLLTNASKYTDPGGRISVAVATEEAEAVVRVRDTGVGIAPEALPDVFDIFVQEERSLSRAQGGLGIGLALVRSLVEMHGGQMTAHSAGLGQGSEFVVRLPTSPAAAAQGLPAAEGGAGVRRPLQVLIVEDDTDTAENLSTLLGLYGYDVRAVPSAPAAREKAAVLCPNVLLVDAGLPGVDAPVLAQQVRTRLGTRPVALITVTGNAQQEADYKRHPASELDFHLLRPVNPDRLRELLALLEIKLSS
jgi:PAS domain S-box-containing protein